MSPRRLFRLFASRSARRRELEDEIEAHLDMRAEELVRQGLSPDEARLEAGRRFGDLDAARRELDATDRRRDRRLRARAQWDVLRTDLALAVRRARRAPGFTLLALVTLGLGTGLTTAVFTSVDRVLLRPLAFAEPERIVSLQSMGESLEPFAQVSSENWLDWDEHNRTLTATALHSSSTPTFAGGSGPVRLRAEEVSGGFFEVLRPPTVAGRVFGAAEVEAGERVAVVSEPLWRAGLGAAEPPFDAELGGATWRVVGVVAREHAYPAGTQVWLPRTFERDGYGSARNRINFEAIGRLAPGMTLQRAREDLGRVARAIRESEPEALYSWGVGVLPLQDWLVEGVRGQLLLLLAAVAAVLVLACLNLAGLSLARTLGRADEVAVRVALGADRGRIVRQLLTEHLVLGLAGGLAGLAVAVGALGAVERSAPAAVPRDALGLDARALAFAIGVSIVAGVLAGVWPALRAARGGDTRSGLGSRGGSARTGAAGGALVAAEVALAVILLVGGGLLLRSFVSVTSRDIGFDPRDVVVADVILDRPEYRLATIAEEDGPGAGARRAFWDAVLDGLAAHPAVAAVGAASAIPTTDGGNGFIEVEGREPGGDGAAYVATSHGYFDALGIELLAGRTFSEADRAGTERVTVVSKTMAERYWPGESPLGRRMRALSMEGYYQDGAPWLTVVGVVDDVRHYALDDDPVPEMYVLHAHVPYWMGTMSLAVRGAEGTDGLGEAVRSTVAAVDPALPLELSALEDQVEGWVADRLWVTSLLAGFSGLALLLAAVGLYGLLAFQVARRTREIGIRAALGADRSRLLAMIVVQSLQVTAYGMAVGLVGAWVLSRSLDALLVDVAPADPLTYGVAGAVLVATALVAASVPAWRAARVDPLTSLRDA